MGFGCRGVRVGLLVAVLVGAGRAGAGDGVEVGNFFNVIAPDGADPWVIRHDDGRYYLTMTTGRDVTIWRSPTLTGLAAGERKTAWRPPAGGSYSRNLWAPELHRLGGRWYVYVAADDGHNANHRMYVLENPADDPFEGEFRLKAKVFDAASDRWAIDGTVLELGGRLYFVWSGWEGWRDVRQDLYIAPMRNPWTIDGPRVAISRPTLRWERLGAPPAVNEGPEALVRDGTIYLFYSASGSWTDHYAIGLLTASADADPLDPASWTKHPAPVFGGGNGVNAPGHASYVRSPDGSEDWIVYHTARWPGSGWSRQVRAQPFTWGGDGLPHFGRPFHGDVPIARPSGEPRRLRLEAERGVLGGGAGVVRRSGASGGLAVAVPGGGSVEFEVEAEADGPHVVSIRYASPAPARGPAAATQRLSVDGGRPSPLRYVRTGRGLWSNAPARVELKAGPNRLRLEGGRGRAEVDGLDVFPERAEGPGGEVVGSAVVPGREGR